MESFWNTTDFYTPSLFVLIFLVVVVIAISASDVIVQALSSAATASGTFKYSNLVVVGVIYSLLAILTVSITCSRFLKTRRRLRVIANDRIPTNHLPKKVEVQVQHGLCLARRVLQTIRPLSSDINHPGWANPDTIAFQGVNLKRAVARTPTIIENAAMEISDMYTRPSFVGIRHYIGFLIRQGIVAKDFGLVYLEGYERARFSKYGPTEEEYMDIMKHLAAILNQMGYHLHQQTTATPSIDDISQHIDITTHRLNNQYHGIMERNGRSNQSCGNQTSGENGSSTYFYKQYRNRNNNSAYSSNDGNLAPHSIPSDDDVISLAQSVATWSSRSAPQQSHLANGFDGDQHDERLRHTIYDRLMTPHI